VYTDAGVSLGHRRLSIIDLSENGRQPMANEDGTVWVTYNGEIYNFLDLRRTLEAKGHTFRSRTDTEVIVHAYEEYGPTCVQRFNGMFAFAIWDSRKRSIFIARDRLGVKPLYYWSNGNHFAFSSELKALLALPQVPRRLSMQALQSYLMYEYVPAPESIFADIQKLPAGHFLEIQLDGSEQGCHTLGWRPQPYWEVRFQEQPRRSIDEYVEELKMLLKAAVARRLISDVPLGVFLSGGIDSSSVVALMSEVGTERPKTFSIGFEEKTFNELDYAEVVARHFDTDHHVEILRPDVYDLLQSVADVLDEPFADASALPTYLVSHTTRQHVTVALGGDAGDELFAGYDWYRAQKLASFSLDYLPDGMRQYLCALASHIPPSAQKKGFCNLIRRFLDGASLPSQLQHLRWQTFWRSDELAQLLIRPPFQHFSSLDPRLLKLLAMSGSARPLDQQQYVDIKRYLPDDILFKVDRMSMAVSLETRGPFLDYTLVEFAASLPPALRLRGITGKYLLKRAMQDMLPQQILHRKKLGFNIPYKNWLRHELRDLLQDALAPKRLKQQGIFCAPYVQSLVHEHLSGRQDHAHKLWQLLMFQLWAEPSSLLQEEIDSRAVNL
jgi:asparagine synthase (glutamine-hydrolysing)